MKHIIYLFLMNFIFFFANSQNVGIGITNP